MSDPMDAVRVYRLLDGADVDHDPFLGLGRLGAAGVEGAAGADAHEEFCQEATFQLLATVMRKKDQSDVYRKLSRVVAKRTGKTAGATPEMEDSSWHGSDQCLSRAALAQSERAATARSPKNARFGFAFCACFAGYVRFASEGFVRQNQQKRQCMPDQQRANAQCTAKTGHSKCEGLIQHLSMALATCSTWQSLKLQTQSSRT